MSRKIPYCEVKRIVEDAGFKLLSERYIDSKTRLKMMCPKGHTVYVTLDNFKRKGERCAYCSGKKQYTIDQVRKYVESRGYKLLSTEYKNVESKLKMLCPKGHKFETTFSTFKHTTIGCMACAAKQRAKSNKSKGEQLIEDIFIHHLSQKHKFIEQFMINVYMDNKSIPHHQYIDFYVPDFNLFIEYDGIQHFQEQKFFDHSLSWQRQHDHHKDAYAKKHHIKMLRIPYTLSRKEVEKRVFNALSH